MATAGNDPVQAEREGIAIAKELVDAAMEKFNGIYLITPFLRYEMTAELTKYIRANDRRRKRKWLFMSKNSLTSIMKERILLLDGAMGTMIQAENLTAEDFGGEEYEGCNEYLVIDVT